ncbi:hypothetical protein IVB05_10115 [Bradyrhizobium sp. 170]|nr:hypothetical protein IVB05_10115 [Bradyrhizobium sp. 170]
MIIEGMKLETVIRSQQDGVADRIHFKDGESFRTLRSFLTSCSSLRSSTSRGAHEKLCHQIPIAMVAAGGLASGGPPHARSTFLIPSPRLFSIVQARQPRVPQCRPAFGRLCPSAKTRL